MFIKFRESKDVERFVHATGNYSTFSSGLFSSLVMVTHAISFVFLDSYFRFLDHIIQENCSYALDSHSMQALNDKNSWCPGFWIVLDSFGEVLDSLDCFG